MPPPGDSLKVRCAPPRGPIAALRRRRSPPPATPLRRPTPSADDRARALSAPNTSQSRTASGFRGAAAGEPAVVWLTQRLAAQLLPKLSPGCSRMGGARTPQAGGPAGRSPSAAAIQRFRRCPPRRPAAQSPVRSARRSGRLPRSPHRGDPVRPRAASTSASRRQRRRGDRAGARTTEPCGIGSTILHRQWSAAPAGPTPCGLPGCSTAGRPAGVPRPSCCTDRPAFASPTTA